MSEWSFRFVHLSEGDKPNSISAVCPKPPAILSK
ncbi:hypothetical protein L195_g062946, partial [Trifolium pratense]